MNKEKHSLRSFAALQSGGATQRNSSLPQTWPLIQREQFWKWHYSGKEAALHVVLQLRKMLSLFIFIIHFIISSFHFSILSISFFFLFIFIMSYPIICTQKRQVQYGTCNFPQYLSSNFLRDKYDQWIIQLNSLNLNSTMLLLIAIIILFGTLFLILKPNKII